MLPQSPTVLRLMETKDLDMILSWRNSPNVRNYMFNSSIISLKDHSAWFSREKNNPRRHLLILEDESIPLGFVNLHQSESGESGTWGFYSSPTAPKGTGRSIGRSALTYCHEVIGLKQLTGDVLGFNEKSIKLHTFLGFTRTSIRKDNASGNGNCFEILTFSIDIPAWYIQNSIKHQ